MGFRFNFFGRKVHRIFQCMSARLFLFFPPVCCVVFGMVCKLAEYVGECVYGYVDEYMCEYVSECVRAYMGGHVCEYVSGYVGACMRE